MTHRKIDASGAVTTYDISSDRPASLYRMVYAALAELTVALHFAFILFVLFGAALALWRRWVIWLHLPCALYGAAIEFVGWICPLTPLENHFRGLAGQAGYAGGFVSHYLLPIIYPGRLPPETRYVLGGLVVAVNVAIYTFVLRRRRRPTD